MGQTEIVKKFYSRNSRTPENNPSQNTRRLYQSVQELFERAGHAAFSPESKHAHTFSVNLHDFHDVPDEVRMEGDDFPYIRTALIDEACLRGDIELIDEVKRNNESS